MYKMVKRIIYEPGRTFNEFCLLPGYTKKDCTIQNISLETKLAGLELKIPLLSAAMTSVTGYEMALALGKEGGIGILPARLLIEDQADIVSRIKNYEMGFVEDPVKVREDSTVEDVLNQIKRYGHSKVPVVDKNNIFLGMFTLQHYLQSSVSLQDKVTDVMLTIEQGEVPCCKEPNISVDEAKGLLERDEQRYLVVLDDNRLEKLAFKKDIEKIKVGSAISTHKGWRERVEANVAADVDLIVIDTSDAHSEFAEDVLEEYKIILEEYKAMKTGVPICAGNIVTYDGALFLMKHGADIVKVGMSSGSVCTTQREKAVGRAPMTSLIEADRARRRYAKRGRDVPLIIDGGVVTSANMVIASTIAHGIMLGSYLNRFYEAEGEKLDEEGNITREESEMRSVAIWGEGSARAQNLERYGQTKKTFFEEGVEGTVPYRGRLKPVLKSDLIRIKAALSNAGCMNLKEFREKAVIEVLSPHSRGIVSEPHSVMEKR